MKREAFLQGYEGVQTGIVKLPMSVIRLAGTGPERIANLADKILTLWRGYSDKKAGKVFSEVLEDAGIYKIPLSAEPGFRRL